MFQSLTKKAAPAKPQPVSPSLRAWRGKVKKVLLVDIDSQANSSKVLLNDYPKIPKEQTIYATILRRQPLPIHPTRVVNLSIIPSHILVSNTDIELTTAKDHREARLKTELDKLKGKFYYIFIDNPPALGWLTINAFTASEKVLVVVSPGYFELDSLVQLSKTLEEVREYSSASNKGSPPQAAGYFRREQSAVLT